MGGSVNTACPILLVLIRFLSSRHPAVATPDLTRNASPCCFAGDCTTNIPVTTAERRPAMGPASSTNVFVSVRYNSQHEYRRQRR
jgi:hypothetical protein